MIKGRIVFYVSFLVAYNSKLFDKIIRKWHNYTMCTKVLKRGSTKKYTGEEYLWENSSKENN